MLKLRVRTHGPELLFSSQAQVRTQIMYQLQKEPFTIRFLVHIDKHTSVGRRSRESDFNIETSRHWRLTLQCTYYLWIPCLDRHKLAGAHWPYTMYADKISGKNRVGRIKSCRCTGHPSSTGCRHSRPGQFSVSRKIEFNCFSHSIKRHSAYSVVMD